MFDGPPEGFPRFVLLPHLSRASARLKWISTAVWSGRPRLHKTDQRFLIISLPVMADAPVIVHL